MDRRRSARIPLHRTVTCSLLAGDRRQITANVVDLSDSGIQLQATAAIVPGTAVRIDIEDGLYLGEVCYCREEAGAFLLGVNLTEILSGLGKLRGLNEKLWQANKGSGESRSYCASRKGLSEVA